MKKTIRLTESDLHRVIKESVKRILREDWEQEYWEGTKSHQMEEQLLSSAEFYCRTMQKYEGLDPQLVRRYGVERDAIEEIATDGKVESIVLSGQNAFNVKSGLDGNEVFHIGSDKVIYQSDWYHISDDPDNLYRKEDLGRGYKLKPNDGVVCVSFDRNMLTDYYTTSESDYQNFSDMSAKHRNNDTQRITRDQKEQDREAERQRVIQRITPPSDEVKNQMDRMWARRNKENKPDLDSKRSERRFRWNDRGAH